MNSVLLVAGKEFRDGVRNRWFVTSTLVFLVLSLGISFYGGAVSGSTEFTSLSSTVASLASLAVFLVPLIALLLGYDSFIGEQENGTLLLLLSYPISKSQLLLGKFLGQGGIISSASAIGFGLAALVLSFYGDPGEVLAVFSLFVLSAVLLGLSFVAMGFVVSLKVEEKSAAAGLAMLVWFFYVLVFDLALVAFLVSTDAALSQQSLTGIMLLNPADVFRLINMLELDPGEYQDAIMVALQADLQLWQLLVIAIAWVGLPLALAMWMFKRKQQ